jgi:hypothetical protein
MRKMTDLDEKHAFDENLDLDEVRSRLRTLGYLESPVERYLAVSRRGGRLGALAVAVQYSLLVGLMLSGLTTVSNLMADPGFIANISDMLLLVLYLGAAYSLVFFVLLLVPSLVWSGRKKPALGRIRLGSPTRAVIMSTIVSAVLCFYLLGWWHAVIRSSQALVSFGLASVAVMVTIGLVSLMAGRLLGFVYLLLSGVTQQRVRRGGRHLARSFSYALAVVVLIEASWAIGVFSHHSADHTLAEALEVYKPPPLRVLVLGLDGMNRETVERMAAADSLTHLSWMISQGYTAPLQSRGEYLAPQVWTTVATGVKPEMHGVEGFTRPVPWGMSRVPRHSVGKPGLKVLFEHILPFAGMIRRVPVSAASRMTCTLWEVNELFGTSAGVVNWWATWPAEISDGFTISERTFPKIAYIHRQQALNPATYYQREVYPAREFDTLVDLGAHLAESFDSMLEDFPALAAMVARRDSNDVAELVHSVCFADYFYCMAALDAGLRNPVNFMAVYFQGADVLDRLEERTDNVRQQEIQPLINEYYRYCDQLLGLLIDRFCPGGLLTVVCEPGKKARIAGKQGLVLFHGMDVSAGESTQEPIMLEDVAPTVLYLSGLPVSSNMSGRALREAGEGGPGGARPLRFVTSYGPPPLRLDTSSRYSNDREMIQRLRSLGYVK